VGPLRRRRGSLRIVLSIGAIILLLLIAGAIFSGTLPFSLLPEAPLTPDVSPTESVPGELTQTMPSVNASSFPGSPGQEPTVSVTLIGPPSSADVWANALLDRVLEQLLQRASPGDGFAWWQGQESTGVLGYDGLGLTFKDEPLSVNDQESLTILSVSPEDPNQTRRLASLRVESSALLINLSSSQPDRGDMQWILSGALPDTALESLVIQAAARSTALKVAYSSDSSGTGATMVLVGALPSSTAAPTPTQNGTPLTVTAVSTSVPPTSTHIPEVQMAVFVESKLKPVIDIGLSFPPDVVASYTAAHAWYGPLTWDEKGPEVDERPVSVNAASELSFLILTPNDPRGPAQPFLRSEYDGNATRFPDEQTYFVGQRMNEVLYWMVSYGARRGGLLLVTYDDFGSRQAITIIGFTPFSQPGTQTAMP
jgi:hypothetical protein